MELYCFTNTTQWVAYEGIQSDLFDHLLAILPEFGLRLYQRPAGGDLQHALGVAAVGTAADVSEGRARP
jgi:miniconductance mechanosensitive channel